MEGEALLLGIWKNVADLEECLNLKELELIVSTRREEQDRQARWLAAVNGINLDATEQESPEDIVERMKRKAEAMREGKTEDEFEWNDLGIDIEVEE